MKIVFLSDEFPPEALGGAGIIAYEDAKALAQKGHEVLVITTTRNKRASGILFEGKIKIHRLYSDYQERWRAYISLNNILLTGHIKKILDEFKPDIVHAHNIHWNLSYKSLKIAKKSGAKVFLTFHDLMSVSYGKFYPDKKEKMSFGRYNPFRNYLIKKYLSYADRLFSVSESVKLVLEEKGIKNITTLYNGIDVNNWITEKTNITDFKKKFSLENKKVIMFGGRLSGAKGGILALEALGKVIQRVPDAVLLVVGSASNGGKRIKDKAHELGLDNYVIFTGAIPHGDMKNVIGASDVVTCLSLYLDPFPTINLEAMACSKPVIGTKLGGTAEAVVHNVTGYIVDTSDRDSVASRLVDLLNNPSKAQMFGRAGYARVCQKFNIDNHIESLLKYYNV
jgi:glycosyltransferase involved in cell wall biosynthesis